MAQFVYTNAMSMIANANLTLVQISTYKMMLVNSSQSTHQADTTVSANLTAAEITATNYTKAWNGAGRLTVTTTSAIVGNVVEIIFSGNVTWTSLGGATNDTVKGVALIKEMPSSDAVSIPIAYWDINPTAGVPTNGSNFTITVSGSGNIQFTT